MNMINTLSLIGVTLALTGCGQNSPPGSDGQASSPIADANEVNVEAVARDAYVYGFPLAMNLKTIYDYVVNRDSPDYKGPFNEISCEARLFTPADTAVVTPNSDTPYCMFWLDLRREPLVISVPDIEEDRYYSIQLIDFYTHNYAYIGTRTTGNQAGRYLLAGPGWAGSKPDGVDDEIPSETDLVFVVVRVQLFDPDDLDRVREIQEGLALQTLSDFLGEPLPPPGDEISFPAWEPGAERNLRAFEYIDFALRLVEPRSDEAALRERFATIGIGGDEPPQITTFDSQQSGKMAAGMEKGLKDMSDFLAANSTDPLMSARIFGTREYLTESAAEMGQPNFYLLRAAAAMAGLYGNTGAEAIYPTFYKDSDGDPLDASQHDYVMRLPAGELPPAKSFWSLSMYDGKTQLFIENPLNRYLLNSSMEEHFLKESDGSIVFYLQAEAPAESLQANWLPAPAGPFYAVMRLYLPTEEVLEGQWTPPVIAKSDDF